ncbi:MAG: hypothetical protein P8R40_01365 [SAR324 cluster bacterium]|nr:hypothetical protein [SAR324 cluster bacterium]
MLITFYFMELKKNSWAVETTKPKKTRKPKSTMAISAVATQ